MEPIITITLSHTGKEESDNLLDWLFEKQDANSFTYEYWYATKADEEKMKILQQLLEPYRDLREWNEIQDHGFKGIVFLNQEDKLYPRYYLNKETVNLIKKWTPYGLISQIEHSGFQNIKVFKNNTLIFGSENLYDVGYLWLTKTQIQEFQILNIPYQFE